MAIGFYARNLITLPHPLYPKATLRIIEKAISEAWRIIRDAPEGDFKMQTADEDRTTRELRTCLTNNVLVSGVVPGFTSRNFRIIREGKFESYDGTHLDKMPDLLIDVIRDTPPSLPSNDGLFVECKPVDHHHPAGGDYCDKGIVRFVKGEYAWALSQGLMIGYAATGYTMPKKLDEALKPRKAALKFKGKLKACPECVAQGYTQQAQISVHKRGFVYPDTGHKAPDITLRHIWFNKQ